MLRGQIKKKNNGPIKILLSVK